jgi:hypothetical protein
VLSIASLIRDVNCGVVVSPVVFALLFAYHTKDDAGLALSGILMLIPLHSVAEVADVTTGAGITVMLKLMLAPVQLLVLGVTLRFAVSVTIPVFMAVKELMSPMPFALNPIAGVSLVQV